MAQHDYVIDNSTGANVRSDINSVLQAIATNNSGSSAPSTTIALQFYADTANNILKLRNAANDGFINLFTLAGGVDVDAASNFNEDVTFQCASGTIVFDKSANDLTFSDSVRARFGDSNDLTIFHDGSNSHIEDAGTGGLLIKGDSVNIGAASGEFYFRGFENGAASLRFDNSTKVETAADRVNITGHIFISDGNLYIKNGFNNANARIRNTGGSGDGNLEFLVTTGGTETEALEITEAGNLRIPNDSKQLRLGAGDDLKLFHDGTNSSIQNGTGTLRIRGDEIKLNNNAASENYLVATANGEVQLYYDNAEKLNTSSAGVFVHGTIGSQPPDKNTRGMSLSSYVVDINQDAQTVATAKINSNKGVCLNLNRFYTTGNILDFRINNDFEGAVEVSPSGVSYNTTSDYRVKENVVAISDGITKLKQLKPYRFNFIAEPSKLCDGFFAHEVTPVVPTAVSGEKDATEIRYYEEGDILPSGKVIGDIKNENSVVPQSLDYAKIVPLITAALQESIAKIEVLETKVAALEAA